MTFLNRLLHIHWEVIQFPWECIQGHNRWECYGIITRNWNFGLVRKVRNR